MFPENEQPEYLVMDKLLQLIGEPNRAACERIWRENQTRFERSFGSTTNHQNWVGGYVDHIHEVMNWAVVLYATMSALRPLPFTLPDALLVLYLHDIEKPWKYELDPADGGLKHVDGMLTEVEAHAFRDQKIVEYGVKLTSEQQNAMAYVHGEGSDYSSKRRVMNELAAFCHICDITSARIWYAYPPKRHIDPWATACRIRD